MKVVIIGGVAGGATAAARLRRLDESAEIIIIERSGYVSYANCGLPYYIGGVITEKEDLTLQTPTSFWNRFRIEVRTHQEAIRIRRKEKAVTVRNLKISAGAGFIVDLTGEIMTMPGLPKSPAAESIDIDSTGRISGLF